VPPGGERGASLRVLGGRPRPENPPQAGTHSPACDVSPPDTWPLSSAVPVASEPPTKAATILGSAWHMARKRSTAFCRFSGVITVSLQTARGSPAGRLRERVSTTGPTQKRVCPPICAVRSAGLVHVRVRRPDAL
jgi:hypothetical protein